jgi:hypothetical protein
MGRLWAGITLLLFLAPLLVYAQPEDDLPPPVPSGDYEINFFLIDSATGSQIRNGTVELLVEGEGGQRDISTLHMRNGALRTMIDKGRWKIRADVNVPATPGKDLAGYKEIEVKGDGNFTMSLLHVGSASVLVKSREGANVAGADVTLSCVGVEGGVVLGLNSAGGLQAGDGGQILINYFPAGSCVISARQDDEIGSVNAEIGEGQFESITVELGGTVKKNGIGLEWIAFVAALLVLVAIAYFVIGKKSADGKEEKNGEVVQDAAPEKTEEKKTEADEDFELGKIAVNEKMRGVLRTLGEREKKIVKLLVKNGGAMKQSKIYNTLLIPKTSLVRALRSLERKNIVKLEPFGKSNSVTLTDWFVK